MYMYVDIYMYKQKNRKRLFIFYITLVNIISFDLGIFNFLLENDKGKKIR